MIAAAEGTPANDVVVRAVGLGKTYGRSSAPVYALRSVSLEVRRGEKIAGRDLARMRARELARHRLSTVGMIFQSFNLIPSRTALENVSLPLVFAGRSRKERSEAARHALGAVGLGERIHHRPAELSGGEMQRVAIARALVNRPSVLLADEPTGNLDSATAAEIVGLITEHTRAHGATLILVTHDEELARRATDRVVRLQDGCLLS
jgi:predicted ABC-type transport system involved in lysophospholipase L1 biosynthesis ATPase subunit